MSNVKLERGLYLVDNMKYFLEEFFLNYFWCYIFPLLKFHRLVVDQLINLLFQKEQIGKFFLNFFCRFLIPIFFSNLNYNCSNFWYMRNFQEQVKKAFCYQKLFWPFTFRINCLSDLKNFENSRPSASNFKSFSRSLGQFFLT